MAAGNLGILGREPRARQVPPAENQPKIMKVRMTPPMSQCVPATPTQTSPDEIRWSASCFGVNVTYVAPAGVTLVSRPVATDSWCGIQLWTESGQYVVGTRRILPHVPYITEDVMAAFEDDLGGARDPR